MRLLDTAALALALVLVASSAAGAEAIPALEWEVLSRRPHDVAAFTQGLLLDESGRLFESTGQYEESTLREVDASSGAVLRERALSDAHFGEGLALVDDRLIQLTWKAGVANVWDAETFELVEVRAYPGQGWGLCYDGERLVMSDGSAMLTFREPSTFEVVSAVEVTLEGQPLLRLNELECVNGQVWANILGSDAIVRIDPIDGAVTGILDLGGIIEPHPAQRRSTNVLNGIAYDAEADTWLVTGKRWPELIEIRIVEAP